MANQQHPNEPGADTRNSNTRPPRQPRDDADDRRRDAARVEYLAETYGYTPGQIDVVRNAICVGATDAELEFFLATCKRVQLDPFARQIWFVKRRQRIEDDFGNATWIDVGKPETSIDGLRTIAERTGEYEGQAPFLWCGPDGKWTDVWLKEGPPTAARATIYRKNLREPMIATALFAEFCPTYKNGGVPAMWKKMGANQLAKCAESNAFRRAFPRDLSGMVTDTEMEHVATTQSNYAAPEKPAQLEERKPDPIDRVSKITSVTEPEQQRETVDVPARAKEAIEEVAASEPGEFDEIDREMATHLKVITGAQSRDQLDGPGAIVSAAKGKDDAYSLAVLDVLKPAIEKRWRELMPKPGRSRP